MRIVLLLFVVIASAAGYFWVQDSGEKEPELTGNALAKYDLIRTASPGSKEAIESPVLVQGQARGYWFFEADFPVKVYDSNGKELGSGIARALQDWMTEEFVPFSVAVEFEKPATPEGVVVLFKDNPSGLPENDEELRIPVRFAR